MSGIKAGRQLSRPTAERELTSKQQALVDTVVRYGVDHRGASEILDCQRSWAYKTLLKPHVQQALKARLNVRALGQAGPSIDKIAELRDGAESETVQLAAAKDLLDRAGVRNAESNVTSLSHADVTINIDLG